jgi:hypothetical protein
MKKGLWAILVLTIMLLTACATRIYGVPEERWDTMSEQERIAAMEAYKARQETLRQRNAEQARLRAMEKKAQLEREAEEARQRQMQIDAIYRGEGLYGDLIRVTLEGGKLKLYGSHQPYHPVSFKIAANEMKKIEIVGRRGRKAHMFVRYDGSNLLVDETPSGYHSMALRLPYEDTWEDGATYSGIFTKGPREMQGVSVLIKIVGQPPRDHHGRRHLHKAVGPLPGHKHHQPEVIVIRKRPGKDSHNYDVWSKKKPSGYPTRIKVVLQKGRWEVKRHSYPLESQTFKMRNGLTRYVTVNKRGNLKLRIIYGNGELLISDSHAHGSEGTLLSFIPTWKDGQRYFIEAVAGSRIENLEILIEPQ